MVRLIIGLDLSISATGYTACLADSETFVIQDIGTIKTALHGKIDKVPHDFTLQERIDAIMMRLQFLNVFEPDIVPLVGIEDYAFSSFGQGFTKLCELQGVVRYTCHRARQVFLPVGVGQIKKQGSGKGNCQKNLMPMKVRNRYAAEIMMYGQELQDDNQADSVPLAHLTWMYWRWKQKLPMSPTLTKDAEKTLIKLDHSEEE